MAVQVKVIIISLIVIILDQLTKFIFKNYFSYTTNTGALFGLFKGYNLLFIIITLIVIIVIIYYMNKHKLKQIETILLSLILGGAVGNLIDRMIYGHVIDFINLKIWPSFNIADAAITIGVIGLVIYYWKK